MAICFPEKVQKKDMIQVSETGGNIGPIGRYIENRYISCLFHGAQGLWLGCVVSFLFSLEEWFLKKMCQISGPWPFDAAEKFSQPKNCWETFIIWTGRSVLCLWDHHPAVLILLWRPFSVICSQDQLGITATCQAGTFWTLQHPVQVRNVRNFLQRIFVSLPVQGLRLSTARKDRCSQYQLPSDGPMRKRYADKRYILGRNDDVCVKLGSTRSLHNGIKGGSNVGNMKFKRNLNQQQLLSQFQWGQGPTRIGAWSIL